MQDRTEHSGAPPTAFADVFAAAVVERRMSLRSLHRRLADRGTPVSMATLSYWRSGKRVPERRASYDALRVLERLLELDEAALTSLVAGPARRAPGERRDFDDVAGTPGATDRVIQSMGGPWPVELSERSEQVVVDFDTEGYSVRLANRTLWRAESDGAQRTVVILQTDRPPKMAPSVRNGHGCSIGLNRWDDESGVLAFEIVLDRALRAGETALSEYVLSGRVDAEPDVSYEIVARGWTSELSLWVRFDAACLPSGCEAYTITDAGEQAAPIELIGTSLHFVTRGFGPGRMGIRWTW